MPQSHRFSVIIPSLNQARFLERAICSVLDQGEPVELIVVDGGSHDGSASIIAEDLHCWMSAPDEGPAEAINRGLAKATAPWVLVLHADDVLLPGSLHEAAAAIDRGPETQWLVGHCLRIGERDQAMGRITATLPESLGAFLMHDSGVLPASATFYRRSLLTACGGFDPSLGFAYDYELACRLLARGHVPALLDRVVAAAREHDGSRSTRHVLGRGQELIDAAERFAGDLGLKQRYAVSRSCDERRRIYALAAAEAQQSESRRFLWHQLLRRPWWLASASYRRVLLQGVAHPGPTRHAA